jgi:hypothetical protein
MENALLYTFSTTTQALAAAFGLLAAFSLYRLQALDAELKEGAFMAIQPFHTHQALLEHMADGDYEAFLDVLDGLIAAPMTSTYNALQSAHVRKLRNVLASRTALRVQLRRSFVLTVFVMAATVTALVLVPIIRESVVASWVSLAAGAGAFMACLNTYYRLMLRLIGQR